MPTPVLVLNAGSSTLKYRVVDPDSGATRLAGLVDRIGRPEVPDHTAALEAMAADLAGHDLGGDALLAVGHRVVHGGPHLTRPVVVTEEVLAEITAAGRLAPLHNPAAVAGITSARALLPHVPQVAVFDTGYFAHLPAAAATYAVDAELARRLDLRRYGAHGISHAWVAGAAADHLGRPVGDVDLVTLHLGNGASAAAIRRGAPVDTSMGLTPLEGLVMGTRGGDLDPGLLVHLLRHGDLDVDGLDDLLHHRSGLLGLAGHADFRDLVAALGRGEPAARLAYDVYCHRLRKYVGAYLAVLGGADAVVFTGGVGEHEAGLRADALAGLEPLGIAVDAGLNHATSRGPRRISPAGSPVAVLVVPTDEELAIARAAAVLLVDR